MSAPGFLLADESNHYLIGYLLEALNNIIQFQFSSMLQVFKKQRKMLRFFFFFLKIDNPNLILAILRNQQKFERLADFSLDNAMIEIERLRLLKETSTNNRPSEEQQDAASITLSEKAKGKLPEGSLSRVSSTSSISQQQPNNMPSRQVSLSSIASTASLLPGVKNGFTPTDDWVSFYN